MQWEASARSAPSASVPERLRRAAGKGGPAGTADQVPALAGTQARSVQFAIYCGLFRIAAWQRIRKGSKTEGWSPREAWLHLREPGPDALA